MRKHSAQLSAARSAASVVLLILAVAASAQERPRDGTTLPRVVREIKPDYTEAAKEARIEGKVWIAVTVRTDGTVADDVEVVRSLDAELGLDDQAVKAAKQWLFAPGTKNGEAVSVRITIEFTFKLAP
jgi:periplasmic protein TonB